MNCGFVQLAPRRLLVRDNLERLLRLLAGASDALIVAPELALSGYLFHDGAELRETALSADAPLLAPLYSLLARNRLWLVLGFPEKAADRVYNSALLAGPDGPVTVYRKIHLFDREKLYFTPGDAAPPVVEAAGARVGLMVCYDWFFPEVSRYLLGKGAQLLLHPANLVLPWCLDAMLTRSLENRVFSITANRTGSERLDGEALGFYGRSQIVGPDGERLASVGADYEGVTVLDLDISRAEHKAITLRNPGPSEVRTDLLRRA